MSGDLEKAPLMIGLGLATLAGAALLAWLSSVATLHLTRTGEHVVRVSIESRLFGLFLIGSERIDDARSPLLIRSRTPGSNSDTPDRLMFETATGPVDRGRGQQLFARDFAEIKTFFDDEAKPATASVSSIARRDERIRFVVAQLAVLFLTLVGVGTISLGAKAIVGRNDDIGPVR